MAHQTIRCNLASVVFPFTLPLWGRSIITPQFDENYERQLVSSADIGKDKGVPMACYLHNCMPTTEGYQAIGYNTNSIGVNGETLFDRIFQLIQITPNDARFLFSPASGKNYIYDATLGGWFQISPFAPGVVGPTTAVSVAYLQGQTYIYYEGIGCYVYDQVVKVLTLTALSGLTASAVNGITTSFGYMIAWNNTQVVWGNASVPTDFVPSLITGAGGGPVNDIKGNIKYCIPVSGGFLVFCEKNIVAAKYTGNIRFPFAFKEIANSGGITSQDQITVGGNNSEVFAYTTNGLQQVTLSSCTNVFPDCSDFLAKRVYEDFNDSTLTWTETNLVNPLYIKLTFVATRFLVISYGINSGIYTYAIIYDSALKRWGKLKVTHVAAFQWNVPNLFGAITYDDLFDSGLTYDDLLTTTYDDLNTSVDTQEFPLQTLSFLQQDGTVLTVNFDLSEDNALGVLLLGKFQFQRNKFITHQYSEIENVSSDAAFAMYVVTTLDGKTLLPPVASTLLLIGDEVRKYGCLVTGKNYSLLFQGQFNLTSVLTDFTLNGDW